MKLKDISFFISNKVPSKDVPIEKYIDTDSLLADKHGRREAIKKPLNGSLTAFKKGDVLVSNIRPYLKKIYFAEEDGGCSPDVLVFRSTEKKLEKFLYAVLLQDNFFFHMMKGAKGSKMPRGDKSQIMEYKFSPIVGEEEQIGDLIDRIRRKIKNLTEINRNLEAMARQLYDYWFVQFDFPGENGRPYKSSGGKMVWNNYLKKEIPETWQVIPLKDQLNLLDFKRIPLSSKQRVERKGEFPYYGATGIMDYINDYIFDGEFILLAEDGSTSDSNGNPVVQYIWGKNWVNNHAHVIIPKVSKHKDFYYFLLKGIRAVLIETGSIQKKITQENLLKHRTLLPPQNLLDEFAEISRPLRLQMEVNRDNLLILAKQRDELLPLLMNGQLSVGLAEVNCDLPLHL